VVGGGGWRVEAELGAQQLELVAFDVADRQAAPLLGGTDHGGEDQFHRRAFVAEPADHLGAPAFLDERALREVGGVHPDAVPDRDAVDRQQCVEVVFEAGHRGRELPPVGVDQPVRRSARSVERRGVPNGVQVTVLESALEGELDDHLGYAKHDPAGRNGENSRNGRRGKTVLTEVGPVEVAVPRDRDGSFEPKLVKKHQRRLTGVEDLVISLSAKGLTTGEIAAHLGDVYGAEVSQQTISAITDRVLEGMAAWQSRPLSALCVKMNP
jgi:hypothetical protein